MTTQEELAEFMGKNGGVASVSEVSAILKLDEGAVRRWAREHAVRRIGATFAFSKERAFQCAEELLGEESAENSRATPTVSEDG